MKKKYNKLVALAQKSTLDKRSRNLRKLVMRGFKNSQKGHVGSSFSMIEILRVLYDDILKYDTKKLDWKFRDRLVVSPGWASLALYAILSDKGFFKAKELDKFMDTDSLLGGCIVKLIPGIEATTGACGHGLSIAIGMALSLKLKKIKRKVFVILGDGEHGEGSIWEAALSAKKNKLDNLVIIVDYNKIQCSGLIKDVTELESLAEKWKSFGTKVHEVNGHDVEAIIDATEEAKAIYERPTLVLCHTIPGKGIKEIEFDHVWHGKPPKPEEEKRFLDELRTLRGKIEASHNE